jgi:CDP-glycerol glycerophosphotransferase (TagB/SpsB family)
MVDRKRVLFAGYAPVHFVCFQPVYQRLREIDALEIWLSGGWRREQGEGQEPRHDVDGFYDPFPVDRERVISFDEAREQAFDAVVCAHSSSGFFPREVGRTVQIFHGVSFKNLLVREKVLRYDLLCVPGRYHAERFAEQGLTDRGASELLLTGFPKVDPLVTGAIDGTRRLEQLGLDPARPTVLYAPTGGKHNSLDACGDEIVGKVAADGRFNLLVKPHDHPKVQVDWFEVLAHHESSWVKLVRDFDVVPYLAAADLLLTDASSVALEYTLLDRPMVFLDVPKLIRNVRKRGGAVDLETYGQKIGTVAASPAEVVPAIADALANPRRHGEMRRKAASHVFHDAGRAADNVAAVVAYAAGHSAELPPQIERVTAGSGA